MAASCAPLLHPIPDATAFERLGTQKLSEHRGNPRLWVEGMFLLKAGFAPAAPILAEFRDGSVTLRLASALADVVPDRGLRRVSSKRKQGREIPVIDLNSAELRQALGSAETVTVRVLHGAITITPSETDAKRARRAATAQSAQAMTEVSIFAGGGLLTKAAELAGYENIAAIEMDPGYAEIFSRNFPRSTMFNMSVHEVPLDRLPTNVGLVTCGIPCEPFSTARRRDRGTGAKRDRSLPPEAHEHGDLMFWALRIIAHCNPVRVVCEEVPGFGDAGASWIFRRALERMGYTVDARVLDPHDFGELTGRRRYVLVATTDGGVQWPVPEVPRRTFGEIMDPADAVADLWWDETAKPWPFAHWRAQTAKGNGFAPEHLTAASPKVPTLKKRYFAGQGDNFTVAHPERPGTHRWLTLTEAARLQGLPADYDLGDSKTTAGEILGQGVVTSFFAKVIAAQHAPAPAPERASARALSLVREAIATASVTSLGAPAGEPGDAADADTPSTTAAQLAFFA